MGSNTKDANRERLEVMKYITTLGVLGVFSLLIANELMYSAKDVLSGMYIKVPGVVMPEQYQVLSSGFLTVGILSIVSSVLLFAIREKQRQSN